MSFVLDEEQQMLARTAREFVREQLPVAAFRAQRDDAEVIGPDRGSWKAMAELGWAGLSLPESVGGLDLGFVELGLVAEELGRTLAATPLLSTVALGAGALLEAGAEAHAGLLAQVAEGDSLLALAYQEGPRHGLASCATLARREGDAYILDGRKDYVLDGATADKLLVLARSSGEKGELAGLSLFLVDARVAGLHREALGMVDGRPAARVLMEQVQVSASDRLGPEGEAATLLQPVLDRATILLCAEMLGSMQEAFDRTVEYLKTRKQFGVLIGSFQALKHRAAEMYCEIALTRSVVMDALRAVDAGREDVAVAASVAKARASEVFLRVTEEGIQMHGGIGVTDEEDIGLYYKRARVTGVLLGDPSDHRDRYAQLLGY